MFLIPQNIKQTFKPQKLLLWLGALWLSFGLASNLMAAAEVRRSMSVEDKVAQLEKQLQTANRMRAEFQFQITNLQNEIRELRGIIEEQSYQLEQITNRQRDIYRNLDQVASNATTAVQPQVDNTTIQVSDADAGGTITPVDAPVEPPVQAAPTEDIRARYDAIFPLVRAKRFDEAIVEYQKFISDYPDSEFVSNSRYWLAQIYVVQGRTDEAEREYLLVAQQYPDSAKAAESLLKLGQLYEDRGQNDKAVQSYQQLLENYSSSNAARFAQSRLDVIGI